MIESPKNFFTVQVFHPRIGSQETRWQWLCTYYIINFCPVQHTPPRPQLFKGGGLPNNVEKLVVQKYSCLIHNHFDTPPSGHDHCEPGWPPLLTHLDYIICVCSLIEENFWKKKGSRACSYISCMAKHISQYPTLSQQSMYILKLRKINQ